MAIFDIGNCDVFSRDAYSSLGDAILMVGLSPDYTCDLDALGLPADANLVFADVGALRPDAMAHLSPKMIVCPLIGLGFDAVDVAGQLAAQNYSGTFRVLCLPLRRSDMILDELHEIAPNLKVDLRKMTIAMPADREID